MTIAHHTDAPPAQPAEAPASLTLAGALGAALADTMTEDPTVVVFGEDVGPLGGVFRVTDGLAARFGEERVWDSPLAEAGIVGTAIGMAMGSRTAFGDRCGRAMSRASALPSPVVAWATMLALPSRRTAFSVNSSGSPGPTPTRWRVPLMALLPPIA